MVSQWWSITLTAIGLGGLVLTMRKHIAGPIIGASVQALWIAYALASSQPAFIASALTYGAVNLYGVLRWIKESDHAKHRGPALRHQRPSRPRTRGGRSRRRHGT